MIVIDDWVDPGSEPDPERVAAWVRKTRHLMRVCGVWECSLCLRRFWGETIAGDASFRWDGVRWQHWHLHKYADGSCMAAHYNCRKVEAAVTPWAV